MPDHQANASSSGSAGVLRWTPRLLVIAGAAMLVWCALVLSDASVAQRIARRSLEIASPPDTLEYASAPVGTTGALRPAPPVLRGGALAELSIPRVQLSAVVLHGSDARTLRRGPGHLENTALPGEAGNVVIAGHRDSFFRPLRDVRLGDDIFMDTPQEHFHYRVTSLRVVHPQDLSVLEPTHDAMLTLITCYPFWVLGNAPDRFVVRAARVMEQTAIPAPIVQAPAASESVALHARPVLDDHALVREAIERFRLTYNGRLINHNEVRAGGMLRFHTCDIAIADDEATATCDVSAESPDNGEPHEWRLTLHRTDDGWAIRSMVTPG